MIYTKRYWKITIVWMLTSMEHEFIKHVDPHSMTTYARHQYNISLNFVFHRMYLCSFSDRCPPSLMPYYSTAWDSSVLMFKCDFPSSFGEVLLTLQKPWDGKRQQLKMTFKNILHMVLIGRWWICFLFENGGLLRNADFGAGVGNLHCFSVT